MLYSIYVNKLVIENENNKYTMYYYTNIPFNIIALLLLRILNL